MLIHTGRSSGKTYQTPLDAHPVEGGYLFLPMYGPRTDWVRNVPAAGTARLRTKGREVELASPRLVNQDEARRLLPPTTKIPPGTSAVLGILRMDVAGQGIRFWQESAGSRATALPVRRLTSRISQRASLSVPAPGRGRGRVGLRTAMVP